MENNYSTNHIVVCICTYKRPIMLSRLLNKLQKQSSNDLFTYSIVVVDNDCNSSAKKTVERYTENSDVIIIYCNEPEQNIALARNRALANAKGNYIAFIDDDEFPEESWLINLYKTCIQFDVTGVLGPVRPHFEMEPPQWIRKGKFFEKGFHHTGYILPWMDTRTSNVLLKNIFICGDKNVFNPKLGRGGEDRDFFKRMIEIGHTFIWCNEAPVYESIPAERCKRIFFLKRALLRGKVSMNFSSFGSLDTIKSIIAVPVYTLMLPFTIFVGQHLFMKYVIKNLEHLGRLLALMRFNIIKENYVMCTDLEILTEEEQYDK